MKKLNKFISDSGYCSRREADRYIAEGRVTVNGVDAAIGSTILDGERVEVDGERVGRTTRRAVYIAFNKPVGVTSTTDAADKDNIIDFIGYKERIFPVGRLDKDSEGLIILTNDGDIVNKILRAGNDNPKEYIVTVDKPITATFLKQMSTGVRILGAITKPAKLVRHDHTTFVIYLTQGLNRQIRRMCQVLGYKVTKLKRIKVLNIELAGLEPGRWRYLTTEEEREMHRLLSSSVGTEEASIEKKVKSENSFSDYRKKGKFNFRKQPYEKADNHKSIHRKEEELASKKQGKPAKYNIVKPTGEPPKHSTAKPTGKPSKLSTAKPTGKPPVRATSTSYPKKRVVRSGSPASNSSGLHGKVSSKNTPPNRTTTGVSSSPAARQKLKAAPIEKQGKIKASPTKSRKR